METEGFVKVIADAATDEVLGVHMVGPEVTELIAEAALAIEMCATAEDLARTIHAHPTLPEALMDAAEAVHGVAVHIFQKPVSPAAH
ncbi:MAG TPA: dihydrolipoyl dehydrogenase, partial [Planctomycetota bacterium]|nr:dihydrolipoyl dehydrogenase [Planctomycetota bacterium]